jgi:hypothetical protein
VAFALLPALVLVVAADMPGMEGMAGMEGRKEGTFQDVGHIEPPLPPPAGPAAPVAAVVAAVAEVGAAVSPPTPLPSIVSLVKVAVVVVVAAVVGNFKLAEKEGCHQAREAELSDRARRCPDSGSGVAAAWLVSDSRRPAAGGGCFLPPKTAGNMASRPPEKLFEKLLAPLSANCSKSVSMLG